jgi:hypothetical protein
LANSEDEYRYWDQYIWQEFHKSIDAMNQDNESSAQMIQRPRKRHPGEPRSAFRNRVGKAQDLRLWALQNSLLGVSFDAAVLQANYVIDRGLRGDSAARVFTTEAEHLRNKVQGCWGECCKRLGLSPRKIGAGAIDFEMPFKQVASDLQSLLAAASELTSSSDPSTRISPVFIASPAGDFGLTQDRNHCSPTSDTVLREDQPDPSRERTASQIAAQNKEQPSTVFRKDGFVWTISFAGSTVLLPHLIGLSYIADLLRKPAVPIDAAQLAGIDLKSTKLVVQPGIPLADERAIKAVRGELAAKKAQTANLKQADWARRASLDEQVEKLEKYLREVETNRRTPRKVAGTSQRARTSVANAINRALDAISECHPRLGDHLKTSIKLGNQPVYMPAEDPSWDF